MATAYPAIKATMGSTPYYLTTMTARSLVDTARPARETDSWASASIEERMQREADLNRVKKAIVPYLAQHPDRFFGAIIVLVDHDCVEFESLPDMIKQLASARLPNAYRSEGERMGFLTIERGERIVLDGQHRWYALRDVIQSADELGDHQGKVGDDDVTVIIIENEDPRKTRRIFNKVNRHAKPTGRADNIVTSEDDGYAWVTRHLLDRDAPLAAREIIDGGATIQQELVNWRSNTLSKGMRHLTTISALYESVRSILGFEGVKDLDRIVTPSDQELHEAYDKVVPWWEDFLKKVDAFREALDDLEIVKTVRFDDRDSRTLLLRPVGQVAFVRGVVKAMDISRDAKHKKPRLTLDEALRRVNQVEWRATADSYWRDTIVRADGRMVARNEAYNLAANLLAYLIGAEYMTDEMKSNLWRDWNDARGRDTEMDWSAASPSERAERAEEIPEDLPGPIS
jgi:DNA sulfur modification protein DndB